MEVLGAAHRPERRSCGRVGWSGEAGDDEVEDGVEVVLGEGVAADHVPVDDGSFDEVGGVIDVESVGEFPALASVPEHVEDRERSFTGEFVE